MTSPRMVVVVPSRSRPEAVGRVVDAWESTGAFADAVVHWVVDGDDPALPDYLHRLEAARQGGAAVQWTLMSRWLPLVPKLNSAAVELGAGQWEALGFAGDDHLPRTPGWTGRYMDVLRELGTGIVYCNDGYQGPALPTQWVMTVDIVRALGAMVPAPVEHLYCDNVVKDLGDAANCLRYLPDVLIEHMHPVVRKAQTDAQYQRVNSRAQYRRDQPAYHAWRASRLVGQAAQIRLLRAQADD